MAYLMCAIHLCFRVNWIQLVLFVFILLKQSERANKQYIGHFLPGLHYVAQKNYLEQWISLLVVSKCVKCNVQNVTKVECYISVGLVTSVYCT